MGLLDGRTPDLAATLAAIPKIELHRHLEGSLRLSTIHELVLQADVDLPHDLHDLRSLVQVGADDPRTPQGFLSKFESLRRVFRSPTIILRLVEEVIADAAAENILYLEMHFTPTALAQEQAFELSDVFEWVTRAASAASARHGMQVGLVASINRHEPIEIGEAVARTAVDWMGQGVVGLSLAGDEERFPSDPFHDLLREAGRAGLGLTIHAGEWDGAESVRRALDVSPDVRIGHGVRALDDLQVTRMAAERRTAFEVCPTSNVQSGAVASAREHPIARMIEAGLQVTLNTDDPSVSQITLADEYSLVIDQVGLSLQTVQGTILASAQAAFQPAAIRKGLETRLKTAFFG